MEAESFKIVHNVPTTPEASAQMNFFRGKIAAWEDLLDLVQDLADWKKRTK